MTAPGAESGKKKPRPRRSWRRRLFRLGLWAAALLVLLRVGVGLGMPWILDRVAAGEGLTCRYERMNLSLLSGSVELWDLQLWPLAAEHEEEAAGDSVVHLEYADVDIDVMALLTGDLVVRRAEVDGLDVSLEEDAEGVLRLAGLPPGSGAVVESETEPEPEADPEPQRALDFTPPLVVMAARLQDVIVHVRHVPTGQERSVHLDLALSHVGSERYPTALECHVWSPGTVDGLRIRGRGRGGPQALTAELQVLGQGVRPHALERLLQLLGFAPIAERIDFGLRLQARVEPRGAEDPVSRGSVTLEELYWRADDAEAVGLDHLQVELPVLEQEAATDAKVHLRGLRGALAVTPEGRLRLGGLEVLPGEATAVAATEPGPGVEPVEPSAAPRLHVAELLVEEVALALANGSVQPAADLRVEVPRLQVRDLSPQPGPEPMVLSALLRVPGAVGGLTLEGSLERAAGPRDLELSLQGRGITLAALAPYLRAAGLEPDLREGELSCRVTGKLDLSGPDLTGGLELHDLELRDERELLRLDGVTVSGLRIGSEQVHVAEVALKGPSLGVVVDPDGTVHVPGLRTLPAPAVPPPVPPPDTVAVDASTPGEDPVTATSVRVDRLTWSGLDLRVTDGWWDPPLEMRLHEVDVVVTGIAVGDAGAEEEPAHLQVSLAMPGARQVQITGELQPRRADGSLAFAVDVDGRGVNLDRLRPYMDAAGLEPLVQDGELNLRLSGTLRSGEEGLSADLAVEDCQLRDGETPWLAVDRLDLAGSFVTAQLLDLQKLHVRGLRVSADRNADGMMCLLGLGLKPTAETVPAPEGAAPPARTSAAPFRLHDVILEDVELTWSDATLPEPLRTVVRARVAVQGLDTGLGAPPARWQAGLQVPGELESLDLDGSLSLAAAGPTVTTRVRAAGLHPDRLAAYLPPGIESILRDGRLQVTVEATQAVTPDGVQRARVAISDLDYRDGEAEEPFVAAASLVAAIHVTPEELVLEELSSTGMTLQLRAAGDALEAAGLRFTTPAPPPASSPPPRDGEPEPSAPRGRRLPALTWQRIRIDKLDFGVDRFLWQANAAAQPVEGSLRLSVPEPQVLLGEDLEALPPAQLRLAGALSELVDHFQADVKLRAFAAEPELDLAFAVDGLHGPGLLERLPDLADRMDASELTDGRLQGQLSVVLRMPRRQATAFDFSRPFGASLELNGLEFRAERDGEVLAGIDAVQAEVTRVLLGSGDLRVAFLEIFEPRLTATRRADGLHALGVVWKDPPVAPEPQPAEPQPAVPLPAVPEAVPTPDRRLPVLRVDLLSLQGLDLDYVDESVTPAVPVPLRGLDVELRGFTNNRENRQPVRFLASVGAGDVALPKRHYGSLVGGIFSSVAGVVTGASDEIEIEQRPFFDELAVSGSLEFQPATKGWIKVGLRSFELQNLRGKASQSGVTIGDGLLDATVDLEFRDDGNLAIDTNLVFQYLSLDEAADGPISTFLKLPAPLDTVLWVLRDQNGEHVIPLSFTVKKDGVSTSQINTAAVGAFGRLVANAIAKSPLRVVGTVTDLFGLTGGAPEPVVYDPVTVQFEPGSSAVGPVQRAVLEPLIELLKGDDSLNVVLDHRLGTADVERARVLANPTAEDCRQLGDRLRHRKAELAQQRERTATEAESLWAAGDDVGAAAATEQMRSLNRELGRTERALDEIYGLLRPGAERRQELRTRTASKAVAIARMEAIGLYLASQGVANVENRVSFRSPRFAPTEEPESDVVLTPRVGLLR